MATRRITEDPQLREFRLMLQQRHAEGQITLERLEREAADWLAAQPAPTDTGALFRTLLLMPCLRKDLSKWLDCGATWTLANAFSAGRCGSLPIPLPDSSADCACANLSAVNVHELWVSGSVREGSFVQLSGKMISDLDLMFQLGPVTLTAPQSESDDWKPCDQPDTTKTQEAHKAPSVSQDDSSNTEDSQEGGAVGGQAASAPSSDRPGGIEIVVEETGQPGFVLLYHKRLPTCRHPGQLPLSAQLVVSLMDKFRARVTQQSTSLSGPAVSTLFDTLSPVPFDLVACVQCRSWPSGDFASRPRRSGFPGVALVARLCQTPIFLVPTGFPGSELEERQWRVSFSRHEHIVYRSMNEVQIACLTTLKYGREIVGEKVKPLKSYYLKTALLWLAEERPPDLWTPETMYAALLLILRYLSVCLRRRFLPCYFYPEVNLLASRTDAELAAVAEAVAELRRRLLPALLALLAGWLGQDNTSSLADRLLCECRPLSESEFQSAASISSIESTTQQLNNSNLDALMLFLEEYMSGRLAPITKPSSTSTVLTCMPICFQAMAESFDNMVPAIAVQHIQPLLQYCVSLWRGERDDEIKKDRWLEEK